MESDRIPLNEIPGPPIGKINVFRPAGFGRRLVALIIDYVIISFPGTVLTYLNAPVASILAMTMMVILYKPLCESRWSATPGKKFLKLKVVDDDGVAPGIVTAVLRNLFFILPIFPYAVVLQRMLETGVDPNVTEEVQAFALEQAPMLWFLILLVWIYLVSCLVALFHSSSRALHDLLAGTQVIKIRS